MLKQYKQAKNKVQNVSCAKLYYFKFNTSFACVKILLVVYINTTSKILTLPQA